MDTFFPLMPIWDKLLNFDALLQISTNNNFIKKLLESKESNFTIGSIWKIISKIFDYNSNLCYCLLASNFGGKQLNISPT